MHVVSGSAGFSAQMVSSLLWRSEGAASGHVNTNARKTRSSLWSPYIQGRSLGRSARFRRYRRMVGREPRLSLKDSPDGPFTGLASFFRVVLSPHGRGHALVLL